MSAKPALLLFLISATGCASLKECDTCSTDKKERHKTLFTWAVGPEEKDKKEGEDKQNGEKPDDDNPRSQPLQSDRPDFTEASSTVGRGVFQFEGGYTYTKDRANNTSNTSHSYPQALFRIGMFDDWFELRIGQNFGNNSSTTGSVTDRFNGAEDTYLGVKLALTEQKQFLPEMALVLQTTIPTGQSDFTAERTLPGINLLYGWDIIEDKLSMGGSTQANKSVEDDGHSYLEIAQSLTIGYTLTEKLSAFTEGYAFFPSGGLSPATKPQYYFDGGFVYQLTYNIQFDINAGIGLNKYADDYFLGTGIVLRY